MLWVRGWVAVCLREEWTLPTVTPGLSRGGPRPVSPTHLSRGRKSELQVPFLCTVPTEHTHGHMCKVKHSARPQGERRLVPGWRRWRSEGLITGFSCRKCTCPLVKPDLLSPGPRSALRIASCRPDGLQLWNRWSKTGPWHLAVAGVPGATGSSSDPLAPRTWPGPPLQPVSAAGGCPAPDAALWPSCFGEEGSIVSVA